MAQTSDPAANDLGLLRSRAGRLRQRLMGLSDSETRFDARGFVTSDPEVRTRLEGVGRGFVTGFNAALGAHDVEALCRVLDHAPGWSRGFAYEGAGMGLALLDRLWPPWRGGRVRALLERAPQHTYLVHVGVGWALARLRRRSPTPPKDLDPLLGWLVFDGYGFHEGYFDWKRWLGPGAKNARPPFDGPVGGIFDQGLGRSIWFSQGADVGAIIEVVSRFEPSRAKDLWSGIGLACTYAGGASVEALRALCAAAGPMRTHLGQGSCFAATARLRAGEIPEHTEVAVDALCRLSVHDAMALCDATLPVGCSDRHSCADYQQWRAAIRATLDERIGR